jgi:O-methyltransferase
MKAASDLYLDLMKKTLSFSLWPEPPQPIDASDNLRRPFRRFLVSLIPRLFPKDWQLFKKIDVTDAEREEGSVRPVYGDTMIGLRRLNNLQFCIETVLKENIEGDFIETGVWRGGACIFMRAVLAAYGDKDRLVFVADSFQGLPKPDPLTYPADEGDRHHLYSSVLGVSQKQVEHNFKRYGLLDDQVRFLKGWFKDTLPRAPIERLAILRLDGDMYESTMDAMTSLYPRLSPGGFCIVDDYFLPACKKAIDDYRAKEGIEAVVEQIDWSGIYWRKG